MAEKIAMFSWDFIKVYCEIHNTEFVLEERYGKACYRCPDEACSVYIPAEIYEKILTECVKRLNAGTLVIGEHWRKRYAGRMYDCTVLNRSGGKQIELAVRPISV